MIVPALGPAALGVKVTEMIQLPPLARLAGQALVWLKSPLAVIFVILRAAPPPFVSVNN